MSGFGDDSNLPQDPPHFSEVVIRHREKIAKLEAQRKAALYQVLLKQRLDLEDATLNSKVPRRIRCAAIKRLELGSCDESLLSETEPSSGDQRYNIYDLKDQLRQLIDDYEDSESIRQKRSEIRELKEKIVARNSHIRTIKQLCEEIESFCPYDSDSIFSCSSDDEY